MFIIYIFIALIAGILLASQAAVNSRLAIAMGNEPLIATFISFSIGTILLFVLAWIKTDLFTNLATIPQQSPWKLLGGVMGAIFVFTTVLLAPKIGITNMLFFIIIGQLSAAVLIDHFGLIQMPIRSVNKEKLLGLGIATIGLIIFFFGNKISEWLHS